MGYYRIRMRDSSRYSSQRLVVNLDSWDENSTFPHGHIVMSLGEIGDTETEVAAILIEHGISHPPFSSAILESLPDRPSNPHELIRKMKEKEREHKKNGDMHEGNERQTNKSKSNNKKKKELEEEKEQDYSQRSKVSTGNSKGRAKDPLAWTIPKKDLIGRVDLRESHSGCVCSIDPPGCEDIDDALSVLTLPNGNIQIGVRILFFFFFPRGLFKIFFLLYFVLSKRISDTLLLLFTSPLYCFALLCF